MKVGKLEGLLQPVEGLYAHTMPAWKPHTVLTFILLGADEQGLQRLFLSGFEAGEGAWSHCTGPPRLTLCLQSVCPPTLGAWTLPPWAPSIYF